MYIHDDVYMLVSLLELLRLLPLGPKTCQNKSRDTNCPRKIVPRYLTMNPYGVIRNTDWMSHGLVQLPCSVCFDATVHLQVPLEH